MIVDILLHVRYQVGYGKEWASKSSYRGTMSVVVES